MDVQLTQAGVALAQLALQNTAGIISDKIKTAKANRDKDVTITELEQIINQLIVDKLEVERIAQQFKSEVERITISDDDINHLHNTVEQIFDVLPQFTPGMDETYKKPLLQLLNVDTLKALQLLGFNYKEAIGQPFTELLANKILSLNKSGSKTTGNKGKGR